jgi:hypothetical protein
VPREDAIDWARLDQAVRRALEALRLWPSQAPAAIGLVADALRTQREGLGVAGTGVATTLSGLEHVVRAAAADLGRAEARLRAVQAAISRLRAS